MIRRAAVLVEVRRVHSRLMAQEVSLHAVDFGVITFVPAERDLVSFPLYQDELVLLVPPLYVDTTAKIKYSVLGPNVSVSENAVITNSIIKNSIVGANAVIENMVIEDSIIGQNAVRAYEEALKLKEVNTLKMNFTAMLVHDLAGYHPGGEHRRRRRDVHAVMLLDIGPLALDAVPLFVHREPERGGVHEELEDLTGGQGLLEPGLAVAAQAALLGRGGAFVSGGQLERPQLGRTLA